MISFRRSFFFLLAMVSTALAQRAPEAFPFEPAQLLTVLPAAPADWKVTRSVADTSLGEWLETRATRAFQPPSLPSAGAPTATPGEVEVSVTDTAGFTPSLAAFVDFSPVKSGVVEKKLLGSLPAIVISGEGGRQFTQVLVSARYLVEITFTALPQEHVENWLRALHFDLLPSKSPTPTIRPREFRLSHIDELRPEKNRSYLVSTTNSKHVEDFLKTLPAEQPTTSIEQKAGN